MNYDLWESGVNVMFLNIGMSKKGSGKMVYILQFTLYLRTSRSECRERDIKIFELKIMIYMICFEIKRYAEL